MSMEISSNYGNYCNSTLSVSKKENNQTEKISKNTSESSKDKVQEYYESLCKKFPNITFNTSKGFMLGDENKIVVNLSYECLKKMANDSEFAKKMELNLSGEEDARKWVYAQAKRDGKILHGVATIYDENGNCRAGGGGMSDAVEGSRNNSTHKLLGKNKTTKGNTRVRSEQGKEIEELIQEERIEKEKYDKRMEKIRKEREAYLESLNEDDDVFKPYQSTKHIQPTNYFNANI